MKFLRYEKSRSKPARPSRIEDRFSLCRLVPSTPRYWPFSGVAAYRPAVVDKTLTSFHNDINRTAKDINASMSKLVLVRSTLTDAAAGKPMAVAASETRPVVALPEPTHARHAIGLPDRRSERLAEPVRAKSSGFTEPQVR